MATTDPSLLAPTPVGLVEETVGEVEGRTPWQLFWYRFKEDRAAMFGLFIVGFLVFIALTAPLISRYIVPAERFPCATPGVAPCERDPKTGKGFVIVHHGPNTLGPNLEFQDKMLTDIGLPKGPNSHWWFGADLSGRDVFVRTLYGTRTALIVAVVATGAAVLIGILLGMIAGYFGGWIDTGISRFIDIVLSMPLLVFAIGISSVCGASLKGCLVINGYGLIKPGMPVVLFIIVLFSWPSIARIIRGQTLSIKQREFVEAARSLGAPNRRILYRDVLPNLIAPIVIYASLLIPATVLFEAYLSFLSLGLPDSIPSWGAMISNGSQNLTVTWWLMFFPGMMLLFTTLSFNLLGDGLRDALDPRTGRG